MYEREWGSSYSNNSIKLPFYEHDAGYATKWRHWEALKFWMAYEYKRWVSLTVRMTLLLLFQCVKVCFS